MKRQLLLKSVDPQLVNLFKDVTSMVLNPASEARESVEGARFLIERQLGEGGFGKVYLGEDTRLDRMVAIKVLNKEVSEVADAAGAAFDEARALAGIEHRHVVPVYDAGKTEEGEVFVVSKFIEGGTLGEALEKGLLSREEFLEKVVELCSALEAVHEAGITHRDIKPDNILLDAERKAVLIDFGIAATLDGARWLQQAGTPKYMSPEQARGQDHLVDAQSDLYSLGAVLYRGLIGDTLKSSSEQSVTSESSERLMQIRLQDLDEHLPPDLAAICQKALAVPKSERYRSAANFARDLTVALSGKRDAVREVFEEVPVVPRGLKPFGPEDADFFLRLVPGRREPSSKLPALIHRWKLRIEDRGLAGEKPFRVGLLYGPSGSGKSSLLKAGLLPQLDDSIIVVRFDASSSETEEHFKRVLCARFPHLDEEESLGMMLGSLRRGGLPTGTKLLIVIDQFEQWLHAHLDRIPTSVLTKALRQCDGNRMQALITLRDEFWRPVTQLMRELDAPMRQGENITLVEPFDQAHGRRVLESLGRGLGCLQGELKRDQRAFLENAVDLVADGRHVSPLRLSLLAQVFEKREWTPDALVGIRTSEDLGSVYLDEAFHDEAGHLMGRQDQARKFLEALLPERSSVIRGDGVSAETLQEVTGLDGSDFEELVRVLDHELRLVTPVEKGYQLAHDYLVRALRYWFAEAQKKSFRGLALLRLENQAQDWMEGDRKKLLPGFVEWFWFCSLTPKAARSEEAKKLMVAANSHYRKRIFIWGSAAAAIAISVTAWIDRRSAKDSVDQLFAARPMELGAALEKTKSFSFWSKDWLKKEFDEATEPARKWRSALLLSQDDQKYQDSLSEALLNAAPGEFPVYLEALRPFSEKTEEFFTQTIRDQDHPERGVRAACAMAYSDLSADFWQTESNRLTTWLESVESGSEWWRFLVPIGPHIESTLRVAAEDGSRTSALLLAEIYSPDLDGLLSEFLVSSPDQLSIYVDHFRRHQEALAVLKEKAGDSSMENEQRARAIAALLAMGEFVSDISLVDLDLHAETVYRAGSLGTDLLTNYLLRSSADTDWHRALLHILAGKDKALIAVTRVEAILSHLKSQYAGNPDAGVHRSIATVLNRWGIPEPKVNPPSESSWYTAPKTGLEFSIIEPKVPLKNGAARYAMASKEMTNKVAVNFGAKGLYPGSEDHEPFGIKTGNSALIFLNALSEKEGLELCYEVSTTSKNRLVPKRGYLELSGYRLPTAEEWQYACYQESPYGFTFGKGSSDLASLHCVYQLPLNSESPGVARLLPSKLGIYDLHGSLSEITMEPFQLKSDVLSKKIDRLLAENTRTRGGLYSVPDLQQLSARLPRIVSYSFLDMPGRPTIRIVRTLNER